MNNKQISKFTIWLYLSLAPINWFPGLPILGLFFLKYISFLLLFVLSVGNVKPSQIKAPFTFLFLITILVFSIPGNLQAYTEILLNIMDIAFIFAMNFVIASSLLTKNDLFNIFYKVSIVIGLICLLSIIAATLGFSYASPAPWRNSFEESALGGYRTGWSNSIFLYIPLSFFIVYNSTNKAQRIISIVVICSIVGSQILSGGRIGLIASILTFFVFTRFNLMNVIIVGLLITISMSYIGIIAIERHFRTTDEQLEVRSGVSDLDKISSGRIGSYQEGIQLFFESPFVGHGFGSNIYLLNGPEVHNTWLKRAIDGGLLYVIPLIVFFVVIYTEGKKRIRGVLNSKSHNVLFHSLFFGALLISLFEPNYLIGSFQGEAFFWAMICCYFK